MLPPSSNPNVSDPERPKMHIPTNEASPMEKRRDGDHQKVHAPQSRKHEHKLAPLEQKPVAHQTAII